MYLAAELKSGVKKNRKIMNNSTIEEQESETPSVLNTIALIVILSINFFICLIFRMGMIKLSLKNLSPVNKIIILDETIKMAALPMQSIIIYHFAQGEFVGEVYGSYYCKLFFHGSIVAVTARYFQARAAFVFGCRGKSVYCEE